MLVDPEILRASAGQLDTAAGDIAAADVGGRTSSVGDAQPGSTTQRVGGRFRQMVTGPA